MTKHLVWLFILIIIGSACRKNSNTEKRFIGRINIDSITVMELPDLRVHLSVENIPLDSIEEMGVCWNRYNKFALIGDNYAAFRINAHSDSVLSQLSTGGVMYFRPYIRISGIVFYGDGYEVILPSKELLSTTSMLLGKEYRRIKKILRRDDGTYTLLMKCQADNSEWMEALILDSNFNLLHRRINQKYNRMEIYDAVLTADGYVAAIETDDGPVSGPTGKELFLQKFTKEALPQWETRIQHEDFNYNCFLRLTQTGPDQIVLNSRAYRANSQDGYLYEQTLNGQGEITGETKSSTNSPMLSLPLVQSFTASDGTFTAISDATELDYNKMLLTCVDANTVIKDTMYGAAERGTPIAIARSRNGQLAVLTNASSENSPIFPRLLFINERTAAIENQATFRSTENGHLYTLTFGNGLSSDTTGNLFISGSIFDRVTTRPFVAKFNGQGQLQWQWAPQPVAGVSQEGATSIPLSDSSVIVFSQKSTVGSADDSLVIYRIRN